MIGNCFNVLALKIVSCCLGFWIFTISLCPWYAIRSQKHIRYVTHCFQDFPQYVLGLFNLRNPFPSYVSQNFSGPFLCTFTSHFDNCRAIEFNSRSKSLGSNFVCVFGSGMNFTVAEYFGTLNLSLNHEKLFLFVSPSVSFLLFLTLFLSLY